MKGRMEEVGGILKIESTLSEGTTIAAEVKLVPQTHGEQ